MLTGEFYQWVVLSQILVMKIKRKVIKKALSNKLTTTNTKDKIHERSLNAQREKKLNIIKKTLENEIEQVNIAFKEILCFIGTLK